MTEILFFGLLLVAAYFLAHHAVMYIEKRADRALGMWRTLWFFVIFFLLVLGAQWLARALFAPEAA